MKMAGRKRKIPEGYIPQWESNSDSDFSSYEFSTEFKRQRLSVPQVSTPNFDMHEIEDPVEAVDLMEVDEDVEQQVPSETASSYDEHFTVHQPQHHQQQEPQDNQQHNQQQEPQLSEGEDEVEDHCQYDLQPHQHHDLEIEDEVRIEENHVDNEEHEQQQQQQQHQQQQQFQEDNKLDDEELPEDAEFPEEDDFAFNSSEAEGEVDNQSFLYLLQKFSEDWIVNECLHKVSKVASSEFWNISVKWMFSLSAAFEKEKKKKFPKFEHIRRKLNVQNVPRISLQTAYVNKTTQQLSIASDTETIPVHKFPGDKFQKVFEIASVKVLIM